MLESITIVTLAIIFLIVFRPGKTPPLENSLTITRAGKYQITLPPRLNLAQPFIESIAEGIKIPSDAVISSAVQYFAIRDAQVNAHGNDAYLLSICYRDLMLYFRVAAPISNESGTYFDSIKAYSIDVIKDFPEGDRFRDSLDLAIVSAVRDAALKRKIEINLLPDT